MVQAMTYDLDQFGRVALKAPDEIQISSMCMVFAESEVTSLLAKGKDRDQIAKGLHRSVVKRAVGMLKRVSVIEPLLFAGGVAQNPCMVGMLHEATGTRILVPEAPQIVRALGAALLSQQYE